MADISSVITGAITAAGAITDTAAGGADTTVADTGAITDTAAAGADTTTAGADTTVAGAITAGDTTAAGAAGADTAGAAGDILLMNSHKRFSNFSFISEDVPKFSICLYNDVLYFFI